VSLDSHWVAPSGDKARYFLTSPSGLLKNRKVTRKVAVIKDQKFQAGDWVKLAENAPRPAIEMLKKIDRVQTAAEIHPSFAFADKPWPSLGWGFVTSKVLEYLQRSRAIFMAKGFKVDSDPVNPLGDGKSWVLIMEPTRNLPFGVDPLEIARQCQSECVRGAAMPVWDGETILVPLWDSGRVPVPEGKESGHSRNTNRRRARKQSSREKLRDAVMFTAIMDRLEGIKYCRFLQQRGISPQPNWFSEGCPKTYPEAYEAGEPWQKRIQDEKSRARKKLLHMEHENPEGLEKLVAMAGKATR
jgi:hypothetical protein